MLTVIIMNIWCDFGNVSEGDYVRAATTTQRGFLYFEDSAQRRYANVERI